MTNNRPFDLLRQNNGKEVEVSLKNAQSYRGKIDSYDIHLNLVLTDASFIEGKEESKVGDVLIRGDAILTIRIL